MGAVVIAYQNPTSGERRRVSLDVETDILIEGTSELSQFPLQSGGTFQDHKTNLPDSFSFTGIVSKTPSIRNPGAADLGRVAAKDLRLPPMLVRPAYPPIQYPQSLPSRPAPNLGTLLTRAPEQPQPRRSEQNTRDNRPTSIQGFWLDEASFVNRCQVIHEELEEIRKKAYACEIIFSQRSGTAYQLTSVKATIAVDKGERSDFQLTFSKVQQTDVRQADVPIPAEILATPITRAGSQAAKDENEAKEEEKSESIARRLLGGSAGAAGKALKGALGR